MCTADSLPLLRFSVLVFKNSSDRKTVAIGTRGFVEGSFQEGF